MNNYIFGYGSLIERESRIRTTQSAVEAFPINLFGFKRGWWARTQTIGLSTTFLGCILDTVADVSQRNTTPTNGIVYEVNEVDFEQLDLREKGYKRTLISADQIDDYLGLLKNDSRVWIYLNEFTGNIVPHANLPSIDFPIVQSYVDICINGCFQIENQFPGAKKNGFAIDFIKSTIHWSESWINDRIFPRRPFIHCPNAAEIDSLLHTYLPDPSIFEKIKIE